MMALPVASVIKVVSKVGSLSSALMDSGLWHSKQILAQ
ncbi:hypothetical protein MNB_SUP05-SYMBIONT-4-434 [hydrothermal vent metagenome]|uniref:Uncharacterized protein n=1 Tax=hydrothermal vent metagenome TaxID=652676 RepID=A0A1W1DY64_9ZZZZ